MVPIFVLWIQLRGMRRVYLLASLLLLPLLVQRSALGQETLEAGAWPAGVVARDTLPTERAYNYNFNEVDVSKLEGWLKWFGYELPAKFSGNVSGWIWAQRSASGWFDVANYRLEGEVESPQLLIESWTLEQARLRFGYAEGVWYVGRLSGSVAKKGSDKSIGQASLVAQLPLATPQTFKIDGSFSQVQMQPLLNAFDLDIAITNLSGKLTLRGDVPLGAVDDIASWNLHGELDIAGIELTDVADFPQLNLTCPVELDAGRWSIAGAQCVIAEQSLRIDAQGEIARGESGTLRDARLPYAASFTSERVDLAMLRSSFRNLPIDGQAIEGIASLSGQVSGSGAQGFEEVNAALRSRQIVVAGETLDDVELLAGLQITDGAPLGLSINLKSARLADGLVNGQIAWNHLARIGQELPSRADLNIIHMDLSRLQSTAIPVSTRGLFSGTADGQLRLQLDRQQKPLDWSGQLRLRIRELTVAGSAVGDVYLSGSKAHAERQLQFQLRDAQSTFSLHATGELERPADETSLAVQLSSYCVTGELNDYRTRLALAEPLGPKFASVPIAASGRFKFAARIQSVLDKPKDFWPTSGSVAFDRLSGSLADHTFTLEDGLLNIRPDAFRLERFRLVSHQDRSEGQAESKGRRSTGQERVVGSALIRRNAQGEHLLNLRVSELDVAPYVTAFAPRYLQGLSGRVQGEARFQKSAATSSWVTNWTGQLDGQVRELRFGEVPLAELDFNGNFRPEQLSLQLDGGLLGGDLDAKLELPSGQLESLLNGPGMRRSASTATVNSNGAKIELNGTLQAIQLDRLMSLFFGPRMGARYAGVANLKLNATSGLGATPTIEAMVDIPSFYFERRSLAQHLEGVVVFEEGDLQIKQLSGGIAGGRIEIVGSLQTSESGRLAGDLRFGAAQLQVPAMAASGRATDKADQFEGHFSYTGRALIGDEISLSGAARLRDAFVMKLPIQDLRSQLHILFSRNGRFHELFARGIRGKALGGVLAGEAHLHGDSRYELSSTVEIGNGRIDQLSRALGFEHIIGTGTFDAQASLRSDDVSKLSALSGPLQIDFQDSDAQSVPILSDIGRLLPVFQLGSTDINSGRLNAIIGQGQLNIEGVALSSDAFSLIGDGSASLTSGGLDINALVSTGDSIEQQIAQRASRKLMMVVLPQLALLGELNDLIRNRTVYLHIGGSPSRPIIQPQVGPTLGRAVLQNVSRRLISAAAAAAATQKN
ncbi:MAG: AsmA-like C-terminal region-containing protein [Pirellulaceae bacterium]